MPGYNRKGRAYPDISLMGSIDFSIFIGGEIYPNGGTSASTPVFAAMVTLVNSHRLSKGLGTLGWITPSLYQHFDRFIHDVVSGDNRCAEFVCCDQGFSAGVGWYCKLQILLLYVQYSDYLCDV